MTESEKSEPRQMTLDEERDRIEGERKLKDMEGRRKMEEDRLKSLLPSAEEVRASTQESGNLDLRIQALAGRAASEGMAADEVAKWAQDVARELDSGNKR